MNKTRFLVAILSVFLLQSLAQAQSDELPKFEVAAEFTTLERPGFGQRRTEPGFGARFTYNLNRVVASKRPDTSSRSNVFNANTMATSPKSSVA